MFQIVLFLFLITQWHTVSATLSVIKVRSNVGESSYCAQYLAYSGKMATSPEAAQWLPLTNLLPWEACEAPSNTTADFKDSVALVKRYNCTFITKADILQSGGAKAAIVATMSNPDNASAQNTSDNETIPVITIPIVVISKDMADKLTVLTNAQVKLFTHYEGRIDYSLAVIWIWAVSTLMIGSYWGGMEYYHYLRKRTRPPIQIVPAASIINANNRRQSARPIGSVSSTTNRRQSAYRTNLINILMMGLLVVMMCTLLLLLYFFYSYLIYIIIALFALASCIAMIQIGNRFFRYIRFTVHTFPSFKLCGSSVELTLVQIILGLCCIALTIYWLVVRNERYAWILQDILGTFFCINILRTLRLPSGMLCALLLIMLFFYDIFWVFITPLFTKDGESVMVHVATKSGDSGEQIPMVFRCIHFKWSELKVICDTWPFSLLGFGDVIIPGLLVTYLHGFDMEVGNSRIYFFTLSAAYGIGLIVTYIAMYLMASAQPALLYLVPFTLIPTFVVAAIRGEVLAVWLGKARRSPRYQGLSEVDTRDTGTRTTGLTQSQRASEGGQLLQPS